MVMIYDFLQARLQSEGTALLLTSLSALAAAKQYLGEPIHCIFDARSVHHVPKSFTQKIFQQKRHIY